MVVEKTHNQLQKGLEWEFEANEEEGLNDHHFVKDQVEKLPVHWWVH